MSVPTRHSYSHKMFKETFECLESKTYFYLVVCWLLGATEGILITHERKIMDEAILIYSPDVRPAVDSQATVNVTLDITFNNIVDVNEKHQILTSSIWVRQSWVSALTVWNASEYGGLKGIIIDSKKVWQPDTALYNNVFEEFSGRLDETATRVRLNSNGFTFWAAPFIFKTLCKINVKHFPFDTQQCKLTFGTWQYHGNEVNIQNTKKLGAIASTRIESGEWEVLKVVIDRRVIFYQCCPNLPYPEISFIIHMKRKSLFYVVNLILPNILISLLAFFSFFIPVECGERMSFVITVLLSMTVFMLMLAESIPPTSEAVSVIGIYYTSSIVQVFLALVATGISLKINYSYMFGEGLSQKAKYILFNVIGPWLGFDIRKSLDTNTKRRQKSLFTQDKPKSPLSLLCGCHCCTGSPEIDSQARCMSLTPHQDNKILSQKGRTGNRTHNCTKIAEEKEDSPLYDAHAAELVLDLNELTPGERQREVANAITHVATSMKDRKAQIHKVNESKLAAAIVDRVFLIVFVFIYALSTTVILLMPNFIK